MRNPNRIENVLESIKKIWKANPDLRLGQLLCNVLRDPTLYYVEDNELIERLEEYYKQYSNETSNIIYGKKKVGDEWIEDKEFICRKFGDITKACFACKRAFTCKATKIEECVFSQKDNVVLASEVENDK